MSQPTFTVKKRRLQNACDECRKRKMKCDSANMPGNICSNCIAFQCECTHVLANAKKKRGPPKGAPKGTRSIGSIVSAILSATKPYVVPEDSEAVKDLLIDLALHIKELELELDELRSLRDNLSSTKSVTHQSPSSSSSSPVTVNSSASSPSSLNLPRNGNLFAVSTSPPHSDFSSVETLTNMVKRLVLDQHVERHWGDSSVTKLVKDAIDIHQVKSDSFTQRSCSGLNCQQSMTEKRLMRAEIWMIYPWQIPEEKPRPPLQFPDSDLLQSLIHLYFININQFFPILHRPTFERSVFEGLHYRDRQFGQVVLAVCACGSRYSKDPKIYYDGSTSEYSVGWKWFKQIELIKGHFTNPPSVYELQLCSLAVMFLQSTSTPEGCWILVSLGIRYAQDVGAHRRRPGEPSVEKELWKRAFWALYILDIFASAFMGRPRATSADDFDVDLPIECDDEFWETEDPEQAFKQPPGRVSYMSAWITFVKLLDIMSIAQRTIYAVRRSDFWTTMGMSGPEWNEKVISELDSMLNNWIDSVPEHLKWDPNQEDLTFLQHSVMLYTTYYWVQIIIHKPFIPKPGSTSNLSFPSMAICANAARSCCHVMEVLQKRSFIAMPNVFMALYNSAVILLLNAWRGKHSEIWIDTNKEMKDVYKCMNIIRSYERRWQCGGTYNDVLGELIYITSVNDDSPNVPRPSLKRRREPEHGHHVAPTSTIILSSLDSLSGSSEDESREIAGSSRVSAVDSCESATISSSHLPEACLQDNDTMFNLPMYSTELGSLPLHNSLDPVQNLGTVDSIVDKADSDQWIDSLFTDMELYMMQPNSSYNAYTYHTWSGVPGLEPDMSDSGSQTTATSIATNSSIREIADTNSTFHLPQAMFYKSGNEPGRQVQLQGSACNAIGGTRQSIGQTNPSNIEDKKQGNIQVFNDGWQGWNMNMNNVDDILQSSAGPHHRY